MLPLVRAFLGERGLELSAEKTTLTCLEDGFDFLGQTVRAKLALDPISFAYDYLRRTGRVSHDDIRQRDPALASAFEALHPESGLSAYRP